MTIRERLGLTGLALVGAGALLVTFVASPFVEPAQAADADSDGLTDAFETAYGTNPNDSTTDDDGWNDWDEIFVYGTDPTEADTDGDSTYDDADSTPLNDGTDADGKSAATATWSENLTAPAWTGTSVMDGKGIYAHSGEFTHSLNLLSIDPGYGPSMDLTITYRSGITYDGPVGNNWNWLPALKLVSGSLEYYPGDGTRHVYDPDVGDPGNFLPPADGLYWNSLIQEGDGTYTLSNVAGGVQHFSTTGAILEVKDRFGNTVTYGYTSGKVSTITDATGHVVDVAWYSTGRVQTLTDDDNRVVTLTYNCNGQLAKVTTPTSSAYPSGRTYQFTYSCGSDVGTLNDNLVRAKDPKGQVWLKNEFDENDRTVKQYLGADYFTFAWPGSGVTEVYDREGNKREWTISGVLPTTLTEYSNRNVRGSDSGNDDPSSWVTTFTHDSTTKQRTKVVYPLGNSVKWVYNAAGSPTSVRRKANDAIADSSTNDLIETFTYDSNYNLMTGHTDERGNTTSYTLSSTSPLTNKVVVTVAHPTVTYPTPDQSISETLGWNNYGQLDSVTDGEGKVRTNIYFHDESDTSIKKGYLKKVVVDDGGLELTTEYAYTSWGDVTSVTNPRGYETTRTVNEYGWVTAETTDTPQSYETTYVYDANGNCTRKEFENVDKTNTRDSGNPWWRTSYTYDILDNRTGMTEEITSSTTRTWGYEYTKNEMLLTQTKPEGNKVRYTYDERDLVYTRTRGYTASEASTDKSYYDANRNRTKWTNGRAKSWTWTYDLFDRNTTATNPLGHYSETIYDKSSNVTEVKRWEDNGGGDILLAHTKQSFDEMGRMYKVERGLLVSSTWTWLPTTLTFDDRSLVTEVLDPRGKATSFGYDGPGRRILVEDALGNQVETTFDANGNPTLIEETEATGYGTAKTFTTEMDYDELDRLEEKRVVNETNSSDKHTTTYAYDSLTLVDQVDPESNSTAWTHDGLSRRLEESITLGGGAYKKRTWAYDKNNRMTSHKDDGNNETTWAWNARDLVTTETYPDTGMKLFEYDDADNVTEWTDPVGTVVSLTYDDNNRNTARTIYRGTGVGGTQDETYVYDALDRMTEGQDDDVTVQLTWDSLSRKMSEASGPNPMSTYGKTTSYLYDAAGNVTQINYPDGSFAAKRTIDDVNRVTLVEDGSNTDIVAVDYYGPGGRLKKLTFGNSTTSEYGYNGFRWVSDLDHKTSTPTTFAGYDMVYDKVGNLLYEEWSHDSGKGNNYSYDKAYRLTQTLQSCADPSAEYATPNSQSYGNKIAYNLTDDSDRSSVVTTPYGGSAATVNYTSNNVHEYTVVGGVNRTYDDAGNLTDDGTFEYTYDYRSQLLTATRKSNSHMEGTYEYDVLGRRTKKTLYDTSSVRYYHDGVHEIEEYDGSGNVLRKYVYRQDIDSIAVMEAKDVADVDNDSNTTETVRLFYHYDARSNVARLTAAAQAVVEAYEYDPYGNITIKDKNGAGVGSTQVGNPIDFQRRHRDVETGLLYFRARHYDPIAGQFLERDPLSLEPGANWREFCSSKPTVHRDPLGMQDGKEEEGDNWEYPLLHYLLPPFSPPKQPGEGPLPPGVSGPVLPPTPGPRPSPPKDPKWGGAIMAPPRDRKDEPEDGGKKPAGGDTKGGTHATTDDGKGDEKPPPEGDKSGDGSDSSSQDDKDDTAFLIGLGAAAATEGLCIGAGAAIGWFFGGPAGSALGVKLGAGFGAPLAAWVGYKVTKYVEKKLNGGP